jgi:DNA-binding LacI/PurR family transcriptional regulator
MTMRELAKLANVSASTVSKAFHGAKDISQETREHIFAVARQYGCYGTFYQGRYNKKVIAHLKSKRQNMRLVL